jgi:hypothetical protein
MSGLHEWMSTDVYPDCLWRCSRCGATSDHLDRPHASSLVDETGEVLGGDPGVFTCDGYVAFKILES